GPPSRTAAASRPPEPEPTNQSTIAAMIQPSQSSWPPTSSASQTPNTITPSPPAFQSAVAAGASVRDTTASPGPSTITANVTSPATSRNAASRWRNSSQSYRLIQAEP